MKYHFPACQYSVSNFHTLAPQSFCAAIMVDIEVDVYKLTERRTYFISYHLFVVVKSDFPIMFYKLIRRRNLAKNFVQGN